MPCTGSVKYITSSFPSIIAVLCIANVCNFCLKVRTVRAVAINESIKLYWTTDHSILETWKNGENRLSMKIKRLLRYLIMEMENSCISNYVFRVNPMFGEIATKI